jgi:hypothetical protein
LVINTGLVPNQSNLPGQTLVRASTGRLEETSERVDQMRVLIMSDMEGISGIVAHRGEQVNGGKPMCQEGRRLTPIR